MVGATPLVREPYDPAERPALSCLGTARRATPRAELERDRRGRGCEWPAPLGSQPVSCSTQLHPRLGGPVQRGLAPVLACRGWLHVGSLCVSSVCGAPTALLLLPLPIPIPIPIPILLHTAEAKPARYAWPETEKQTGREEESRGRGGIKCGGCPPPASVQFLFPLLLPRLRRLSVCLLLRLACAWREASIRQDGAPQDLQCALRCLCCHAGRHAVSRAAPSP